jgi:hypothetical protein
MIWRTCTLYLFIASRWSMLLQMNIVGLDIAKSGFQINGSESPGEAVPPGAPDASEASGFAQPTVHVVECAFVGIAILGLARLEIMIGALNSHHFLVFCR